ncbi:MAG: hypothetical protein HYV51_01800 [Parcubacteria group bacterium]|nr:hypothetical protein [Parcubacteria group bacterium]
MDKVSEQFYRIERWYKRLKEISTKKGQEQSTYYQEDVVYTFFQNCFHLKDWIINSGVLEKNIVDGFIESNTDMKICRDLCNGSKHLAITNPSIDSNIAVDTTEFFISVGGFAENKAVCWVHVDGYPSLDALVLAEMCLMWWRIFFEKQGLKLSNNNLI